MTMAAVIIGLWMRNLNDRVMLVVVTFLLIAVKSSLAPLTVAGLFLGIRMSEVAEERRSPTGLQPSPRSDTAAEASKAAAAVER